MTKVVVFLFVAIDHDGARLEGEVDATSQDEARYILREQFPELKRIVSLKAREEKPVRSVELKLSPAEMVAFYRRLAVLLGAGVNIDKAFAFLSDSSDGNLAIVSNTLRKDMIAGRNLKQSMDRPELSQVFSPLAKGLVRTGLQTGGLSSTLSRLADILERRFAQRQAFLSALTYPIILSLCIAGVALLFLLFVAPGETGLFSMISGELPWPSQILVSLSNVLRNPVLWATLAVAVSILVPLLRASWHSESSLKAYFDQNLLKVPLLGSLIERSTAAQVLYVWSVAVRVGLPLATAITLSQQVISNLDICTRLKAAESDFQEGADLGESLRSQKVFPTLVTSMITVSLETGEFDNMMERVSKLYEDEVEMALDQLASVIEPLLLTLAGIMAGFVALACLMPMLKLTSSL